MALVRKACRRLCEEFCGEWLSLVREWGKGVVGGGVDEKRRWGRRTYEWLA